MNPVCSVIIPSYNHAPFVGAAVQSALIQGVDVEVVVVDDGSRDHSLALLRAISDPRVRLIAQENRGAHAAIDRGLREARGRYLAILNSDDIFVPERLKVAIDAFAHDPEIALVGSYIEVIDAHGGTLGLKEGYATLDPWPVPDPAVTFKADEDLRTALLMQNYWATTSNYIFPRETYERHGPFRPLRYCHDWDFALRVLQSHRALLIPRPLLKYRVHGSNTISENRTAMVYEICWVLASHLPSYLSDRAFWRLGASRRAEQLLHSVYVYGCDSVLLGMLALIHLGPPGAAERLLDPGDASRDVFMEEISQILTRQTEREPHPPDQLGRGSGTLLSSLWRRLGTLTRKDLL